MNHHYEDILSRIPDPPLWWDEHAVPRFCEFHPSQCANIYAREVVLMRIECQGCGAQFQVCGSRSAYQAAQHGTLAALILSGQIDYGDPPNNGCCAAGPTMSSIPRQIIQYWANKDIPWEWHREAELEVAIDPDWVTS